MWLLFGDAPCKNQTTGVLFIKEVRKHFTSEVGGGVGWVICCRHDFFEKVGFPLYIQL